MAVQHKKLHEQTIVITGASSGIGLTTAKEAARRGAAVMLAARNEQALRQAVEEIQQEGGRASYAAVDVSHRDQVHGLAARTIETFGGFDTWVNNAAVTIYGSLMEVEIEDLRRLFEVDFWGQVYGARVAVPHLIERGGGSLINIGSVVSDQAIPLQGMYSAAKHAIKGFTDALRMELEKEGAPVSVTLIKPGSINTLYLEHAKNYMEHKPNFPPPVYHPRIVAQAILHAAEHGDRDLTVGGGGRLISALSNFPRMGDRYLEATGFAQQQREEIEDDHGDRALYKATPEDGRETGSYPGWTRQTSFYTQAELHPLLTTMAALGLGVAAGAALFGYRYRADRGERGDHREAQTVPISAGSSDMGAVTRP